MKAVIIAGSQKDMDHVLEIVEHLKAFKIPTAVHVSSAHKTPQSVLNIVRRYNWANEPTIFIAVAGRSNALGGMIDGATHFPVINCPPPSDKFAGLDVLSSLRMPSGIASATVLEPDQAALLAAKIFGLGDKKVASGVKTVQKERRQLIKEADSNVQSQG
jgi:5-(carboxyamino)imidazole ribonucleotide mutase